MRVRVRLPLRDGVTVVIVNWNSLRHLEVSVRAVQEFSDGVEIIVVDNASTDGSLAWLSRAGIRCIELDRNVGHGPALDLGALAARTTWIVALDVDAFPIDRSWLDALLTPLRSGSVVCGAHGGEVLDSLSPERPTDQLGREFVHPCCLAMALRDFVLRRHSFMKDPSRNMDVGESISRREGERVSYLEPTSTVGPGALGTVFAGVVYHNFYGTRHAGNHGGMLEGISAGDAERVWDLSVKRYLSR
jgi:glycosyltransferase involved in cell wall biosynthesis